MWMSHPSLPGIVKTVTDAAFFGGWDTLGWVSAAAPAGPPQPDAGWPVSEGEVVTLVGEAVAAQLPSAVAAGTTGKLDTTVANATYVPKGGALVNVKDYASLKAAIAAVGAGGAVLVPNDGTAYYAGDSTYDSTYMATANITIRGEKMPHLTTNADRLEGGSVIWGRFNAFADGLCVENVGFDLGKHIIDTHFGGVDTHTANHPLGGTWDAFAFAQPNMGSPLAPRKGVRIENVIGLLRDSQSVGHAVLMEGIDGLTVPDATGVGGVHALVIKSKNVYAGTLRGWAASVNGVILKADSYSDAGHIDIGMAESLTVPPGTSPWFTPAFASHGIYFNPASATFSGPIQIGRVKVFGASVGIGVDGGADYHVNDVAISTVMLDTYTGAMASGIDRLTCHALRWSIGELVLNGAAQGIAWNNPNAGEAGDTLSIGTAKLTGCWTRAINASGYGRIKADLMQITTAAVAYYIADTARLILGKEILASVTTKWERTPPALAANWANFGGANSVWDVRLEGYGVKIEGLLLAAASAPGIFATVPVYLSPQANKRLGGYLNNGSRNYALIGVATNGNLDLNDNTAPAEGNYISVDDCGWQHY